MTIDVSAARKTSVDELAPTVTVSRDNALLAKDDEVGITIESDEKLRSEVSVVSVIGPPGPSPSMGSRRQARRAVGVHSST